MKQPPGFDDTTHPDFVCKLHKSIYGLKQSPRQWFSKITTTLQAFGFIFSKADPSLLIYAKDNTRLFVLIYVDDILVTVNDKSQIAHLLRQLHSKFNLKQLGDISLFLGIQVAKTKTDYFLNQTHYAKQLLLSVGFNNSKAALTPMSLKRSTGFASTEEFSDPQLYRKIAGSLQYLSITRPDIAFTTNYICQRMHKPSVDDFQTLKRLLRYVQGTTDLGIPIDPGDLQLRAFADADWAADNSDRRLITGFCTFLSNTIIS
ncbi:uncharacterized protein LOC110106054 [Dendrobium catenatum]|uniref:uncharacterized protein LOC110106054 n=1 Tax=Dendrobium catenatum TaxID=906689 RepID=UPI0009F67B41|nr:uncharacterized protein LOC110106054 [Dendrobium catenatum]